MRAKPLSSDQKQILARMDYCSSEAGSVSRFVPIDAEQGVKLYTNRKMRNLCYQRQEIACNNDIGPKCWHPFTFKWMGIQWHGFFTERVTLHPPEMSFEESFTTKNILQRKVAEVFGIGDDCKWIDMHNENWGRTKDGRCVAIDFSHFEDKLGNGRKVQPSWMYKREDNRRLSSY